MTRPCASLNWYEPGASGIVPAGGRATTPSDPPAHGPTGRAARATFAVRRTGAALAHSGTPDDGEHALDDLVLLLGGEVRRAREAQHPVGDLHGDVAAEHLAVPIRRLDPHRRPDRAGLDAAVPQGLAHRLAGAVVGEHRGREPTGPLRPRLVGATGHADVGERVAVAAGDGAPRLDQTVEPLHLDHADRGRD